ncbi:MAG TPA: hypothetical protein VL916_01950, partial [Ilumatobacteraceae bacterium]|nr:hypothetical protein [Ilumatobacteraceae bacterium]
MPGLNEFSAGLWSCTSDKAGAVTLSNSSPGVAGLRGLDKGEDVVCTIVNSHVDQGFEFDKTAVSSVQRPDGTWDVTYKITVHNNSVVVPIEYDLTDTLDEPADGVRYLDASWTGPTEGEFDLEESLTADLATGAELPPYAESDSDAVYTVVVHVVIDKAPTTADSCPEDDGIGIVNSATVTVGEDSDTDADCGTIHVDDVGIVKAASSESVEPGVPFDYILEVTNHGTRTATDVHVRDADFNARLDIQSVSLPEGVDWGPEPGWTENAGEQENDVLDLEIASIAVGETVEVTITVVLNPQPAVSSSDPGAPVPTAPEPLDELENEACVDTAADQIEGPFDGGEFAPNCDDLTIEVREMTGVVYTACVSDTAQLVYDIRVSSALAQLPVSGEWVTAEDPQDPSHRVSIDEFFSNPAGVTGTVQWPGSQFVGNPPVAVDYPGWRALEASDYGPNGGYINPEDGLEYAPEDAGFFVFNGLILDPSELDFAWRGQSTVTFSVNPTIAFDIEYPESTAACEQARQSDVQIEKTASVEKTDPGASFTYSLAVENKSADSAADAVVVTDAIPADIKITNVTWTGKGDDTVFPNWTSCEVTGQNSAGYGGMLTCELFGPLQPQGATEGATAAPTITLAATVNPGSKASSITNVAVVDYHTFGDPDDPGRDSDDAIVLLSALPATGGELPPLLVLLGLLALL